MISIRFDDSFNNLLSISELPEILRKKFVGRIKKDSILEDATYFIKNYIHNWAVQNNLTLECEQDILLFILNIIHIE